KDLVGLCGRGVVGRFDDRAGADALGVAVGDDVAQSSGDEDVAVALEELFVGDDVAPRDLGQRPPGDRQVQQRRHVEAVGVVDPAGDVAQGHDLHAHVVQHRGGPRADVANTLDGDAAVGQIDVPT